MQLYSTLLLSSQLKSVIKKRKGETGFSLIELVVVVAVLAVLAAIAVPAYNNITENGRTSAAKTALANALKECAVSKADTGNGTHTALSNGSGLTFTSGLLGTGCTETKATVCVDNTTKASYSADLSKGVKTSGTGSADNNLSPCKSGNGDAW